MSHDGIMKKKVYLDFGKKANVHIWLSNKASGFYNFLNRLISIPCILISAVSITIFYLIFIKMIVIFQYIQMRYLI